LALLAAALVLAQVALGGLVSAGYAGLSCPSLVDCMPSAPAWNALDPFSEPVPGTRPGALAQAVHRAGAIALALALVPLGVAALRRGLLGGTALIALVALQVALGIALVLGALPLSLALLHNAVAALIFASVVRLT
jgi:cytochrome c oxidase assembly protein subunit 15